MTTNNSNNSNTETKTWDQWVITQCQNEPAWSAWVDQQDEQNQPPIQDEVNDDDDDGNSDTQSENAISDAGDYSSDDTQSESDASDTDNAIAETRFPSTPKSNSLQSVKRQLFKSPGKPSTQAIQAIQAIQDVQSRYEVPEKAKTRAAKRAPIDEDEEEDSPSNFITPQKKERRTEYWALQDDLRLRRARVFKERGQNLIEGV